MRGYGLATWHHVMWCDMQLVLKKCYTACGIQKLGSDCIICFHISVLHALC